MAAKPCLIPAPDSTQQWTMCRRAARFQHDLDACGGPAARVWGFSARTRRPAGLGAGTGAGHSCALVLPHIKRPQTWSSLQNVRTIDRDGV